MGGFEEMKKRLRSRVAPEVRSTPEGDRLYKEWFRGEGKGVEYGKGGPIVVNPPDPPRPRQPRDSMNSKERDDWFYERGKKKD